MGLNAEAEVYGTFAVGTYCRNGVRRFYVEAWGTDNEGERPEVVTIIEGEGDLDAGRKALRGMLTHTLAKLEGVAG